MRTGPIQQFLVRCYQTQQSPPGHETNRCISLHHYDQVGLAATRYLPLSVGLALYFLSMNGLSSIKSMYLSAARRRSSEQKVRVDTTVTLTAFIRSAAMSERKSPSPVNRMMLSTYSLNCIAWTVISISMLPLTLVNPLSGSVNTLL